MGTKAYSAGGGWTGQIPLNVFDAPGGPGAQPTPGAIRADVTIRGASSGGLELVLEFNVMGSARIPIFHGIWLPAELGQILEDGLPSPP